MLTAQEKRQRLRAPPFRVEDQSMIRIHFRYHIEGALIHGVVVTWTDRRQQVAADLQARGYHVLARYGE